MPYRNYSTMHSEGIKLELAELQEGDTIRIVCPMCDGGSSREKSLSVTRNFDSGVYNCYRASCGVKGFIPLNPLALPKIREHVPYKPKGWLEAKFDGADLWTPDFKYSVFVEKYELDIDIMRLNDFSIRNGIQFINKDYRHHIGTGLWLPLRDFNWQQWGIYTKKVEGYEWLSDNKTWTCKTDDVDFPYYVPGGFDYKHDDTVYFVEDPLSAVKVAQLGYLAVGLLGTHFQPNHVLELIKQKIRRIVWMLDPDTWQNSKQAKAVSLANRIGPIVEHRIVCMEKDPKDTPLDELEEICQRN